jgi:hypothetical protein
MKPHRTSPGEVEFASWLDLLREERDKACPDDRRHVIGQDFPIGYFARCIACGHLISLPF